MKIMLTIAIFAAAAALAACAGTENRETEVVAGGPDYVSVRAAEDADPNPVAAEYCEKYGKQAVRRLVVPIPDHATPGMSIYPFACL